LRAVTDSRIESGLPFDVIGKRAAAAIESSTLVVIEAAPHGFNATHAEEFNRALLEFQRS